MKQPVKSTLVTKRAKRNENKGKVKRSSDTAWSGYEPGSQKSMADGAIRCAVENNAGARARIRVG